MIVPHEGELTTTEQTVYDLICEPIEVAPPTTKAMAFALNLAEPVVAAVCDGLEAMGFIRRCAGLWVPNYEES